MIHNPLPAEVEAEVRAAARAYAVKADPTQHGRRIVFQDFTEAAFLWIDEGDSYADATPAERAAVEWARSRGY